ncbi:MAG: glycosyltransferase family 2 protein [Candidatus Gastranaerophilales bacterium]|nr:glycosyltransferase family 2 protein [Candidatus Gastranaerophilales bacterium]
MIIDSNLVKEPKISLIVTYYNLGKYIQDCILSILNQTYQNFEIIIVNDCSNEENSNILQNIYSEKVKIVNLDKNKGQLLSFLEGVKYASGEFICMIDADDILLPNYLKTLLYAHLNHNFALISCGCGEINHKNEVTSYRVNDFKDINYQEIENLFKESNAFEIRRVKEPFGLWSWNPSSSAMFRKSALDILEFFPDKSYWKTGADKVIFSFLHLVGGSANITSINYLYRHHSENNSQTTLTTGNKKFLSEGYVKKLIAWNKKLRLDTIKMFIKNREELIERYNKINYLKMFYTVVFCVNLKVCAKIIKTFAHKLIQL